MQRHRHLVILGILALVCSSFACAATQPDTFLVSRSPLLGMSDARRVACLGFNSEDIRINARLDYLFTRQLLADSTMMVVDPQTVLRELTGRAYITGYITESLALIVGRAVDADVVLIGEVSQIFTEQYGEEKKFRVIEALRPAGGSRNMQLRLADVPYWIPYIDQKVTLTATIRALDAATGREIGEDRVTFSDSLHIVLPAFVENPPEEAISVERVTPGLLDKTTVGLARRLAEKFTLHAVPITRYVKRKIKGGGDGLYALTQGNWEQAQAVWEQLVREEPENPGAWNNLAITYELTDRLSDALEAYDRALALRPNDKTIRRNKGRLVATKMRRKLGIVE